MSRSDKMDNLRLKQFEALSSRNANDWLNLNLAGLALVFGISLIAFAIQKLTVFHLFSPLILSIFLGILIRNTVGVSRFCQPGIRFSLKRLLRVAIVLLGLQLSLENVKTIGVTGFLLTLLILASTFGLTLWLGKQLKVDAKLTRLIAAGTSICGASAVIATNTVVEDSEENVAYAVAMVTLFGTLSMLLYPLLPVLLQLTPEQFGFFCGSSIHEVAQVVAAAFQNGAVSGQMATIVKLSRVLLLAPMILLLGLCLMRAEVRERKLGLAQLPIPWFIFYFLLVIVLNSLHLIPEPFRLRLLEVNQGLLTVALAAMGLETDLLKLRQIGAKPLYLAALSWLFISGFSLLLIKMVPL